jgi:hypothetical protein
MQIVHAGKMDWGPSLVAHRQGNIAHKRLFDGEEGSPDNFSWSLARENGEYFSPRHRHNWDQVRFCLEGSVPIGKQMKVSAGEVGYFPEGVPYGPQKGGPDRLVLVLQFGGASGQGFMSPEQTERGHEALCAEGRFDKGVFHRERGDGRRTQDAYEAIWQQVFERPVFYPAPRYKTPIVMCPEGFAWQPCQAQAGVRRKLLGQFSERGLMLELIAIEPDAGFHTGPSKDRRLLFVREGEGHCNSEDYETLSAVCLEPDEEGSFLGRAPSELLVITMAMLKRRG